MTISAMASSGLPAFIQDFAWESGKTPLTSVNFFIGIHVGFIALFALLRMYMDGRKDPVPIAGALGMAHSGVLTVISALTLTLAIIGGSITNRFESIDALVCSRTSPNVGLVPFTVWLCFLTKILEFGDVALLILAKKPVRWALTIHHFTTMAMIWHAAHTEMATEVLAMITHLAAHTAMYLYFICRGSLARSHDARKSIVRASLLVPLRNGVAVLTLLQFLAMLGACLIASMKRSVGSPCEGTQLAEFHGVVMYGAYIALFGGSLCAAAAAPNKDEGNGALSMDAGEKVVCDESQEGENSSLEVVAASRAVRGSPLTVSALINVCADASVCGTLPCSNEPADGPCGSDVAWMSEKLCVPKDVKASAWAATRVLIRTVAIGAVGVLCISHLGTAIGALILAYCLSSLYVIGQDCAKGIYFPSDLANNVVGTFVLLPLLRPLEAVKKNVASNEAFYRRAAAKLFGDASASSLCVWGVMAAAAVFVAHRGIVQGLWILAKYWFLPLLIMHVNVRTFESSGGRDSHNVLFPELSLHKHLSEITSRSRKQKRKRKRMSAAVAVLSAIKKEFSDLEEQLAETPLYHLSAAAEHVRSRVASRMRFIATHELALSTSSRKSGSMAHSDSSASSSCSSDEDSGKEMDSVLTARRGEAFYSEIANAFSARCIRVRKGVLPLRDMISETGISLLGRDTILAIAIASFVFPCVRMGVGASSTAIALCAILMASTVASLCVQGKVGNGAVVRGIGGLVLSTAVVLCAGKGAGDFFQLITSVAEFAANHPAKISLIPVLVLSACYLLVPFASKEKYGLMFILNLEKAVSAPSRIFYPAVASLSYALKRGSISESEDDAQVRSSPIRRRRRRQKRRSPRSMSPVLEGLDRNRSPPVELKAPKMRSLESLDHDRSPPVEIKAPKMRSLESLGHDLTVRWLQALNLGHLNAGEQVDGELLAQVEIPDDLEQFVPNVLERRKLCRRIDAAKELGIDEALLSASRITSFDHAKDVYRVHDACPEDACPTQDTCLARDECPAQDENLTQDAHECHASLPKAPTSPRPPQDNRVAIVGYSCILPGGKNVSESWQMIVDGLDCISELPSDRVDVTSYWHPDKTTKDKIYCKRGGFIPDFEFEPREFNLNLKQMEDTDTNQTLTLLKVKEAMQDAGIEPFTKAKKNIGCVLGIGGGQKASNEFYSRLNYVVVEKVLRKMGMAENDVDAAVEKFKAHYPEWRLDSFPGFLGNVTSGRVTNVFNMDGMNCVVDAACASSLVSVKVAIDELLHGNCSTMIAGECPLLKCFIYH